jgi:hypothetical protein
VGKAAQMLSKRKPRDTLRAEGEKSEGAITNWRKSEGAVKQSWMSNVPGWIELNRLWVERRMNYVNAWVMNPAQLTRHVSVELCCEKAMLNRHNKVAPS